MHVFISNAVTRHCVGIQRGQHIAQVSTQTCCRHVWLTCAKHKTWLFYRQLLWSWTVSNTLLYAVVVPVLINRAQPDSARIRLLKSNQRRVQEGRVARQAAAQDEIDERR
jgi:hypothetical protein